MISFDELLEKRINAENQSIEFSKLSNQYPKNLMGLVDDSIRTSIDYKILKDKYTMAHYNLRAINIYLNKNYKKEFKQYQQNKRLQYRKTT